MMKTRLTIWFLAGALVGFLIPIKQGGSVALADGLATKPADRQTLPLATPAEKTADKNPGLADKGVELPKPPAGRVEPYVIHLPGVSGTSIVDHTLRAGMKAAGFDGPFEIYDWTCRDPGIPALRNRQRNEQQAQVVADMITKRYRAHPNQPIFLTCHSGGVGPAIWALEKLPADIMVHSLVMLGPAMSPQYDLSKALARVKEKAYYYWSPTDDLVLGTGTRLFGTIDGVRSEAAGKVGFSKPTMPADEKQYAKLVSRQYEADWARLGNVGGHVGWMATSFIRIVVAPGLLGKTPTQAEMDDAVRGVVPEMDVQWPKVGSEGKK